MSKSQKLVLLGGGHTHALFCLHILRNPKLIQANNLEVVLISEEADSPYSGMLPGLIEDYYNERETHINLIKLCESAQVRLIIEKVIKIDVEKNLLYFEPSSGRPSFSFDYLSINTGSVPIIPANLPNAVPVKPIAEFLKVIKTLSANEAISLVGGGISGVEVALALRSRFPEMTIENQDGYMKFISRCLSVNGMFYSCNHESNMNGQSSVRSAVNRIGGFKTVYRAPFMMRDGYVEEFYRKA